MSQLLASARVAGSNLASSGLSTMEDKPPMCLSPQDKLKGSTKVGLAQRMKTASLAPSITSVSAAAAILAMDFDMGDASAIDLDVDLDLDLVGGDEDDQDMDEAGWISDDNLRALDFDDRLNQDIDWVTHDDVETSLKLEFIPSGDDVQDFGFGASSFLSPLRGGLSFEDSDMSSSFAESLSVDTPPPSFGCSHDAEKLLMSFDTMNFTIPSPTSSSRKTSRASLFGKTETDAKNGSAAASAKSGSGVAAGSAARQGLASTGTMSPSLKMKAGAAADETRKDDALASLSKLSIPSTDSLLGVLTITTPTSSNPTIDTQKKIGSYSPEARRLRIQKFHEKRKNRTWKKSIKYDCRKKLADDRPRIKGRFVRVLENACEIKEEDVCSSGSPSSPASVSGAPLLSASPTKPVLPLLATGSLLQVQPLLSVPAAMTPAVPTATPSVPAVSTAQVAAPTTVSIKVEPLSTANAIAPLSASSS